MAAMGVPRRPVMGIPLLWALLALCAQAAQLRVHGGDALGSGSIAADAGASSAHHGAQHKGQRRAADVYYVARILDKLKDYSQKVFFAVKDRTKSENERLEAAKAAATSDQAAIDEAIQFNKDEETEELLAVREALETYYTSKLAMGSEAGVPDCAFLFCGENAKCVTGKGGKTCACDTCYVGDGFTCTKTICADQASVAPMMLVGPPPPGFPIVPRPMPETVKDIQIALVSQGVQERLAVVFRDGSNDKGSLVVGSVKGMDVAWGDFMPFSADVRAFGPYVAGLPNGRLVISFRDAPVGGYAFIVGGELQGKTYKATLTAPMALAPAVSETVKLVPLSSSRVACLYPGRTTDEQGHLKHIYGGAALLHALEGGKISILGRYKFANGHMVESIAATALSPNSLVAAYRVVPASTAHKMGDVSAELSAVWMGMEDDELIIDAKPMQLESDKVDMTIRDVSLVSQNMFSYTYQSKAEQIVKMAVVRVDPATHRMSITGGPQVLGRGDMDFLHSISLPNGAASPTTFSYFQQPNHTGMAEVCRVSPEGRVADCRDVMWGDQTFQAASGTRMADGRLGMVTVGPFGKMWFQILGPEESGAQVGMR